MDTRALMALLVLSGAIGCGFAPSGGASSGGDGDAPGAVDAAQPAGDSGSGGIGGDHVDAAVAAAQPCAPAEGLVACYQFESNLDDASAAGNDLSGSGYAFDAGSAGLALSMTSGSSIAPINDDSLDFDQELTMEAWIDPGESQDRLFVDHQAQWGFRVEADGDLRCSVLLVTDEGPRNAAVTAGQAGNGAWTHVACTYDDSDLVLYQDGVEVGSVEAEGAIDTSDEGGFAVGRDAPDGAPFLGRIDTVRIWSRALAPEELECRAHGSC